MKCMKENLPISFKPNVDIAKFIWKMQKKYGNPFWGWTVSFSGRYPTITVNVFD